MINQAIIDLYDEFTHSRLDRRDFMARLVKLSGSTAYAAALFPLLAANAAAAAQISASDERLLIERVSVSDNAEFNGYLSQPKGDTALPSVIVIHENRGLNSHIEDVTRRFAAAGFLALAPDFLSPVGGTPTDEDAARELIANLDAGVTRKNLLSARQFLATHPRSNGRVGAVGFCWGGGKVGELAVHDPALNAGVVYYGRQPASGEVEKIRAPLQLHYAGLDQRINEGIPAFEQALNTAHKTYELFIYEGANHAFNNDTSAARYNKASAELAWSRTTEFFKRHLR